MEWSGKALPRRWWSSKDLKEKGEQALGKCKGSEVHAYLVCERLG